MTEKREHTITIIYSIDEVERVSYIKKCRFHEGFKVIDHSLPKNEDEGYIILWKKEKFT